MSNLRKLDIVQKLMAKGYNQSEAEKVWTDVCEMLRESIENLQSVSIPNLGKIMPLVKKKPPHLIKKGTFDRTFKVKFVQSRSLQENFKEKNSPEIANSKILRLKVRNLLK